MASHSTISHQINSLKFWPIKESTCHAFRHLGFQIKIKISFLLTVHKSFKYLAWKGICLIAFSKGILILTCLKVSKISELWLTFLCLVMGWGNKSTSGESVFSLQCSDSTPSLPSEIDSSYFSQASRVSFSITLPLRRVMTDLTWSIWWLPELLAFALYGPLTFCCGWDGNLPFSWKLRVDVNFARLSLKSIMVWASWVLSVDCLLLFNECMQCFLKISSRRWSIRRCISMGILEIMVCLKWWLWSLCIIVITLSIEIWVISPTRVVYLRVWVMIGPLETF